MGLKSLFLKPIAKAVSRIEDQKALQATTRQSKTFHYLIAKAKNTLFGKEHQFAHIKTYEDFKQKVPIRDYEALKPYFDKIVAGEENICWQGKPLYFAKTSGTTSGAKYIPITKDSINHHISAARNALFSYVANSGKSSFFDKKMIFLQGSPILFDTNGIKTGRLSGIVYHHVPAWLLQNRKPSYPTNCLSDWEQKVDAIVEETYQEDMSLISGIPPWCIMYFERLLAKTGKQTVQEIFPNFKLFVYGGVNYEPYREKIEKLIGFKIDTIETYPASEGFFAYQTQTNSSALRLNIDAGIFYELVEADTFYSDNPKRIELAEVELHKNYVLVVSTNAGLWAYNTGDTIKFVSKNPYEIIVSGRIKHFISAFGEHVIAEEVEQALSQASAKHQAEVTEFSVAPFVAKNTKEKSYHEWFVEFSQAPKDAEAFAQTLDAVVQQKNTYYKDLRQGNILAMPVLQVLPKGSFKQYQQQQGKLGGQNKVVHLSNNRDLVDRLMLPLTVQI